MPLGPQEETDGIWMTIILSWSTYEEMHFNPTAVENQPRMGGIAA
jgi:hypothetical protein